MVPLLGWLDAAAAADSAGAVAVLDQDGQDVAEEGTVVKLPSWTCCHVPSFEMVRAEGENPATCTHFPMEAWLLSPISGH